MADVVVVLPGITGSVLRDSRGRDLWAPTAGAAMRALVRLGRSTTELKAFAGRFAAPLVFLNACRTNSQSPLYATVEGWAASFLRASAGAFLGSLWEVVGTLASTYAQEFYHAALGRHALGESACQARDAIGDNPGAPIWLAYSLYGDPAATVSTARGAAA
jgi:CHAT domain-containing protein